MSGQTDDRELTLVGTEPQSDDREIVLWFSFGVRAFHFEIENTMKAKDVRLQFDLKTFKGKDVVLSYLSLNGADCHN